MKTTAKALIRNMIAHFPFKDRILAKGALLPPNWKTWLVFKIFSVLASKSNFFGSMQTNLGITTKFVYMIPDQHHTAIYGKPDFYIGERGALELSAILGAHARAFVDVGSYIGYYVYFVRNRLSITTPIYYFEPDPEFYDLISTNVRTNELKNIYGFKKAVGAATGIAQLYKDISDPSCSSLHNFYGTKHKTQLIDIPIMTLSDFIHTENLSNVCVKVDVENAEHDFIQGAKGVLDTVPYLIMEVLGPAIQKGFIKEMINVCGYNAYYINDYRLEYTPNGDFTYVNGQLNWLFCRENPSQLRNLLMKSPLEIVSQRY